MRFLPAFEKSAVVDMSEEARVTALAPMQTAVPGTSLRDGAETAQARGRTTRTGVLNEDREMGSKFRRRWRNSRLP